MLKSQLASAPAGPSSVSAASVAPSVKSPRTPSRLPGRFAMLRTELRASPYRTGKAPEKNSVSRMKSTLTRPSAPPEAPWVAKWLICGMRMPSR